MKTLLLILIPFMSLAKTPIQIQKILDSEYQGKKYHIKKEKEEYRVKFSDTLFLYFSKDAE